MYPGLICTLRITGFLILLTVSSELFSFHRVLEVIVILKILMLKTLVKIFVLDILDWYEPYHVSNWRQKALDHIFEHICADDEFTKGISIGPVSMSICVIPLLAKGGYFKR